MSAIDCFVTVCLFSGLVSKAKGDVLKRKRCERKRRSVAGQSSLYSDYYQPVSIDFWIILVFINMAGPFLGQLGVPVLELKRSLCWLFCILYIFYI